MGGLGWGNLCWTKNWKTRYVFPIFYIRKTLPRLFSKTCFTQWNVITTFEKQYLKNKSQTKIAWHKNNKNCYAWLTAFVYEFISWYIFFLLTFSRWATPFVFVAVGSILSFHSIKKSATISSIQNLELVLFTSFLLSSHLTNNM